MKENFSFLFLVFTFIIYIQKRVKIKRFFSSSSNDLLYALKHIFYYEKLQFSLFKAFKI